jgi:hypothetical protein
MTKMDEYQAFAFAKAAVAAEPSMADALIRGIMAGQTEAIKKLNEQLSWANLSTDMALHIAMGKRVTQGTKDIAEHVLRKRLESMGSLNGIEQEFLDRAE